MMLAMVANVHRPLTWFRYPVFLAVVFAVSFGAAPAQAKKKRNAPVKAAIVIAASDDTPPELIAAARAAIREIATRLPQYPFTMGKALRRRLKGDPGVTLNACGNDVDCVANLGRKARSAEVIYGKVSAKAVSAALNVLVIDSQTAKVVRKLRIDLPGVEIVKPVILARAGEIFGVSTNGKLDLPGHVGQVLVDGEVIGSGSGPYSVPAGAHVVVIADVSHDVLIEPGRTWRIGELADDEPDILGPMGADDLALEDIPLAGLHPPGNREPDGNGGTGNDITAVSTRAGDGDSGARSGSDKGGGFGALGWTGAAVGGLGVISLGVAGRMGLTYLDAKDQIRKADADRSSVTQLEVERITGKGNRARAQGLLLAAIGGVAVASATVLFYMTGSDRATAGILITPEGAHVSCAWSW